MIQYYGSSDFTRKDKGSCLVGLGFVLIMFGMGIVIGGML